ncbi:MAG: site-2 protease family protein [Kofleriaceae bacterium]
MFFKSWRLGRLLGFPVEINLSFLILLALVFVAFGGIAGVFVVCLAFASVLLHELGHALVGRALGVHTESIELGFLGGAAKMINLPRTASHELMIAAAGPAVSLMLGGAGLGLAALLDWPFLAMVGWINLVIAGFNLIPALPMDGGRIMRALLVGKLGFVRATDVAVTVSRAVAIGFVVLGLTGYYQLLVLAPFLWLMGNRERMIARMAPAPYARHHAGVDVLPRDWDGPAPGGWGSPFDHRGPGTLRRYTIVHRNGRLVIEALD